MNDLDKDLIPRSQIEIKRKESSESFLPIFHETVFKCVKYVDNSGWGLIEISYKPEKQNDFIRIEIWNDLVIGGNIQIDDILIRNIHQNVYYNNNDFVYINNRYIRK